MLLLLSLLCLVLPLATGLRDNWAITQKDISEQDKLAIEKLGDEVRFIPCLLMAVN